MTWAGWAWLAMVGPAAGEPSVVAEPPPASEPALGEAGRRLADQAVLVRAVVAIDGVQVDDFGLTSSS